MSSTTKKSTVAFFGATGGCAANTLALALKAGHTATALARTPSKLRRLLEETHCVPSSTINAQLTIIEGNVKDIGAVKQTLVNSDRIVDKIVFGVGSTPKFQRSLTSPITLQDTTVCEEGMKTIIAALHSLQADGESYGADKPVVICISTTGLSKTRDVPLPMYALYHYLLAVPHADKKRMEERLVEAAVSQPASSRVLDDFVIVRPTVLVDGQMKGLESVRAGWEAPEGSSAAGEKAPGPQLGYTVSRADVGNWIFQEAIQGGKRWCGKCATLTY